ncbi:FAD dependent oxidoreductase [Cadophora sp. DSE1049]|nr:FAD dependent oxidoreductase [Cadophora sp. DSE1049]
MTTYLDMEPFVTQMKSPGFPGLDGHTAPLPSDFPDGDSYWMKNFKIPGEAEAQAADLPSEVDVVIIGSGITGAAVAYRLAQQQSHLRVAMVEARGICSGATGRNGGHIARAEAFDIRHVADKFGVEDAIRIRRMILRNRDMMLEVIEKLGVADEIDLRLDGGLAVFGSAEEREGFEKDMEFAQNHGMTLECSLLSPDQVLEKCSISPEIAKYGAAYLEKAGSMYPRKFIAAMLRHVKTQMKNFTIHPYHPVTSVSKIAEYGNSSTARQSYEIITDKGIIRTRAVVHATNAYASHLLPSLAGKHGVFGCKCEVIAIQHNHATSTQNPLKQSFGYDQVWHWIMQRPDNGPFIYGWSGIEKLLDYDDSKTLAENHESRAFMSKWLEESFPKTFENVDWGRDVKNCWSGIQGYTIDGSSFVGNPSADSPGEFMSVGHNGEGMGRCFACATVLVDKMVHYLEGKDEQATWSAPEWFPRAFVHDG